MARSNAVPEIRIQAWNNESVAERGKYVLYWMTAARRTQWNHSLDRAFHWCDKLDRPLLALEVLPLAACPSEFHRTFLYQGMQDNAAAFRRAGVTYFPFIERSSGQGEQLARALASFACAVVADEFPCADVPQSLQSVARGAKVRLEVVDSCGLLPLRAAEKEFVLARSFRRFLQIELPKHLLHAPSGRPFRKKRPEADIPQKVYSRFSPSDVSSALATGGHPEGRRIFHGGSKKARARARTFVTEELSRYEELRHRPSARTSFLSPYLHFGHLSSHEVFWRVAQEEGWSPQRLSYARGERSGFWGMGRAAESYLDQLVTWRELSFNFCFTRPDYHRYSSVPEWARATLKKHANDKRKVLYSRKELEQAGTHDALWNAAQRQLLREGVIHNALRMLWGKKILEWSTSPERAWTVALALNNAHALDGNDPNSYAAIAWLFGRYDRPWGPERPIFGTVRYMSSKNAAKKMDVNEYLERFGAEA